VTAAGLRPKKCGAGAGWKCAGRERTKNCNSRRTLLATFCWPNPPCIIFHLFSIMWTSVTPRDYDEQKAVVVANHHYQGCWWNTKYAIHQKWAISGLPVTCGRHSVLSGPQKHPRKIFKSEICWEVWGGACLVGLLALDKVYLHMNNYYKTLSVHHYWFCFIYFTMELERTTLR